jgi:Arm DNA-binding domain
MTTESSNEAPDTRPTDMDREIAENGTRPDLVWDNEAPGLCIRILGNGEKSFIFVYRHDNRQRFVRIGKSPMRSLEAARKRAKELRAVIEQGGHPEIYNQQRDEVRPTSYETNRVRPVEDVIRYIADQLGRKS